jgi:hypothetical protein
MHITEIQTKCGQKFSGVIEKWRPQFNWFSIVDGDGLRSFSFDDVKSVVTKGERISINEIGDQDEIERARKYLADGRKFGWNGVPEEKFAWE